MSSAYGVKCFLLEQQWYHEKLCVVGTLSENWVSSHSDQVSFSSHSGWEWRVGDLGYQLHLHKAKIVMIFRNCDLGFPPRYPGSVIRERVSVYRWTCFWISHFLPCDDRGGGVLPSTTHRPAQILSPTSACSTQRPSSTSLAVLYLIQTNLKVKQRVCKCSHHTFPLATGKHEWILLHSNQRGCGVSPLPVYCQVTETCSAAAKIWC